MEASARPPSGFRRFIGGPFLSGLLGAGVMLWWFGILLSASDALGSQRSPTLVGLGFVVAVWLGMTRGYLAPVESYAALLGRLAGGLFFGSVVVFGSIVAVEIGLRGDDHRLTAITLVGALYAGLAVARLHGRALAAWVRGDVAARWKAGVAAGVLALGMAWSLSAAVRCRLGDGASCRAAGNDADDREDVTRAADLFERGCAHGDAVSCRLAAYRVRLRDPARAEDLLHEGCLRGDPMACGRVHTQRLEERCDRYSVSACRQLAEAYARGDDGTRDPSASARLFRKACLLGDEEACQR